MEKGWNEAMASVQIEVEHGFSIVSNTWPFLNAVWKMHIYSSVRRPDKTATDTTTPKGKYTESLTFSTPNCIYANYGKLGKLHLCMKTRQNGH